MPSQNINGSNFASKVAVELLKRELTIAFNTVENILQMPYFIVMGKIITPEHIIGMLSKSNLCMDISLKTSIQYDTI